MIGFACAVVGAFALPRLWVAVVERRRLARALSARRAAWGKAYPFERDAVAVARYHALASDKGRAGVLEDGDWHDLHMDAVHAHLDRAESFAGRARLYDRLRAPTTDLVSLRRFDEIATLFERDGSAREQVQGALVSADAPDGAILELLFARLPVPSPLRHLFLLLGALTLISAGAIPFWPPAAAFALGFAGLGIAVRVVHGRRLLGWMAALRATNVLLGVAARLAALRIPGLQPELEVIGAVRGRLKALARASSWVSADKLRESEDAQIVRTYLNGFLLIDLAALHACFELARRSRSDVRRHEGGNPKKGRLNAAWRHR
jgi:hypothetical protein